VVRRPGSGVERPPPISAEVKERVELYVHLPLGLHGVFLGELYLYVYDVLRKVAASATSRN